MHCSSKLNSKNIFYSLLSLKYCFFLSFFSISFFLCRFSPSFSQNKSNSHLSLSSSSSNSHLSLSLSLIIITHCSSITEAHTPFIHRQHTHHHPSSSPIHHPPHRQPYSSSPTHAPSPIHSPIHPSSSLKLSIQSTIAMGSGLGFMFMAMGLCFSICGHFGAIDEIFGVFCLQGYFKSYGFLCL